MIYRRLYNYPTMGFGNPFEQLDRMRRQIERFFGNASDVRREAAGSGVFPQVNLTEDADKYYLRAELPGITSDQIEIQATGKSLSISGERKIETENDGVRYHRREREAGRFSRVIGMPGEIDSQRIEARLQDGILTVFVPKAEASKPRRIAIN
jgi:HSP20 family protein